MSDFSFETKAATLAHDDETAAEVVSELQHDVARKLEEPRERARRNTRAYSLVLFAVIILLLLVMMGLGVNAYRAIANAGDTAHAERQLTSLIATNVHMMDQQDCISVEAGPQGDALVITERVDDAAYEMRFYLYDGHIVQEYAVAGSPFAPESAQPLAATSVFEAAVDGQLVTVTTDAGTTAIGLRSQQGGER